MEVSVGLGREAGDNRGVPLRLEVFLDHVRDEVPPLALLHQSEPCLSIADRNLLQIVDLSIENQKPHGNHVISSQKAWQEYRGTSLITTPPHPP